jgi:Ala-tRNA(Pro) deacylase
MFSTNQIKEHLDDRGVNYSLWPDYYEEHIETDFKGPVKTVVLKIDDQYAFMVTSSYEHIDLTRMKSILHAKTIEFASEEEYKDLFPECDATALPALGSLADMPVYCSQKVLEDEEVCFNPGTHDKVVKVPVQEFISLEKPKTGNFTKYGYCETEYDYLY